MKISSQFADSFIKKDDINSALESSIEKLGILNKKSGVGSEYLGWMNLSEIISEKELERVISVAGKFQTYETVIVIGIGGSYLGSKAIIDLFKPYFKDSETEILFAGQNLDEDYLQELLDYVNNKNFGIVVISKSGTTLEPALAFRLLLENLKNRLENAEIKNRVVAITDKEKGALKDLANVYQLESFVVPDNVGGRYSVLTPVGLLPMAIAGIDIEKLIQSAKKASVEFLKEEKVNPAIIYATYRNLLYKNDFTNEIMVYSKPKWGAFAEWWKQLFGESEGKDNKGIFPISMNITTDLHSLGQYVQEGRRNLFETFIRFTEKETTLEVVNSIENYDKLNYLSGINFHTINSKAEQGTIEAHYNGGVPILQIELEKLNIETIGELIYFFEISCAISGYVLGVNPFNQPGVEAYKKNMFKLLGKK